MEQTRRRIQTEAEKRFSLLRLENIRCFEKAEIPLDPRLTVVIGENGAGKTTVAEAIASLSYGDEEGLQSFPLRRGKSSGSIALFDAKEKKPQAVWRSGRKGSIRQRLPDQRYIFAYGRYRRVSDPVSGAADDSPRNEDPRVLLDELATAVTERRTTTLNIPDGRLLRDLSRYLVALHAGRSFDRSMQTVWKRLEQSLKELQQGLERIKMVRGKTAYTPMIVRHGVQLSINELSDGYQAVLVILFDLMLRYANLFSSLEDPLEGTATVLIDEIDLHLHVRWQRTVLQQLTTFYSRKRSSSSQLTHPLWYRRPLIMNMRLLSSKKQKERCRQNRSAHQSGNGCVMPALAPYLSKDSYLVLTLAIPPKYKQQKKKSVACVAESNQVVQLTRTENVCLAY